VITLIASSGSNKCVKKADVRSGASYLYDLKYDPRCIIDKPFLSLFFYVPRSVLDDATAQSRARRIGGLICEPGIGRDDAIVRLEASIPNITTRSATIAIRLMIKWTILNVVKLIPSIMMRPERRASDSPSRRCSAAGRDEQ
jgi:hypothetical protein